MKKLVFATLGVAGLMAFTSCSQEDLSINPGGDGVTFTIELPRGVQSRGNFGDGTDAGDRATLNNLQYTVYEVVNGTTSTTPVFSDTKIGAFAGSQTTETVTIPLAKGKSYQVVFYADDSTNSFASYSNGVVSVDYAEAASNVAGEDAFIGKSTQFTVDGSYTESVTLKRPFAQLNWGTDDTDAKVLTDVINSLTGTVKITSGLYTQFDILAGNVVGTSAVNDENGTSFAAVNFSDLPSQTFPLATQPNDYKLIAMNYLLTGNGTIDCELVLNNGLSAVKVNAAPVQINHRTNIYGSLLTAPAEFNITVDNEFATPDNDIEQKNVLVWDGTSTATVEKVDGVYTISTPAEYIGFLQNVNYNQIKQGDKVVVTADMDFGGHNYTRNKIWANQDTGYSLTFDFEGHTISGLVAPLVDDLCATVNNVTFSNCNITGTTNANGYIGILSNNFRGSLNNVNIENCTITCTGTGRSVGGICGQYSSGVSATNCTVKNLTIKDANTYKAGGLFGSVNQETVNRTFTNLTAENVTIEASADNTTQGAIMGRAYGVNITFNNVSQVNCTPSVLCGSLQGGATITGE